MHASLMSVIALAVCASCQHEHYDDDYANRENDERKSSSALTSSPAGDGDGSGGPQKRDYVYQPDESGNPDEFWKGTKVESDSQKPNRKYRRGIKEDSLEAPGDGADANEPDQLQIEGQAADVGGKYSTK